MKKAMLHTKVSVKLRKSELRDEWYLYLEAYPVFKPGHDKPCREREYLNRIITTPMWDKTRPARIDKDGVQTYKPKRDMNGIIICRSKTDRETCIFADNVRNLRQHEYDSAELYTDTDQEMVEKKAKGQINFIDYFAKVTETRHKKFCWHLSDYRTKVVHRTQFCTSECRPIQTRNAICIQEDIVCW